MSSVSSSSGSSGQDDTTRKIRDEYRKKEAELVKKHNKEVRELNEKYSREIDKKDRTHSAHLNDARSKSQESLTQRDVKYRNEMQELRGMHAKQLEKLMQENQTKLESQRKSAGSEIKQAYLGKNDRIKELHDRYEEQMATESSRYQNKLDEIRAKQKEELGEVREQLTTAHNSEVENLQDERNETVARLKNDYRQVRQSSNKQLREKEINHMQDKSRLENAHMDNIMRESEAHNEIQEVTKEGFDENLDILRQRMNTARERDAQNQYEINEDFQSRVDDQMENRVKRLERALQKAKGDTITENAQREREKNTQVNNVRNAYQQKFDYLEKARRDTLKQSGEINAQNINKMRGEFDKLAIDTGKYYNDRVEIENYKNRQALADAKMDSELKQEYLEGKTENRVEKIRTDAQDQNMRLNENYKTNLEIMKGSNEEEKNELRSQLSKQKDEAVKMIKSDAHKQEIDQQRRVDDIVAKYEKRIAEMNDRAVREKRLRENHEKVLVNSLKRQHDLEKETLRIQYEEQNKQANAKRDKEVQDMNRRHVEKLNDVLSTVKKSNT